MERLSLAALGALVVLSCASSPPPSPGATATPGGPPSPSVTASADPTSMLIPQPEPPAGLQLAPESARVDLAVPAFNNPTQITNPLFPVSIQQSVLLLGEVDGQAFRTEVTLLPYTRVVDWADQRIEALISQYVAFLDGRIHEVAYDYYAQDDAGNVWYLGEDVYNFADGAIVDTHGTWIAGIDAPGAMIMPADPQVGDVYRPENAPGLVFEEVTVKEVGRTLEGPLGPVEGGIVVEELHMDGATEEKIFAPGYGEFFTSDGTDTEALALAVPTDALGTPVPEPVGALSDAAVRLIDEARRGAWDAAASTLVEVRAAWDAVPAGESPSLVTEIVPGTLDDLAAAVDRRKAAAVQAAAIEVARSALDLELRHRPPIEIELARLGLWAAQLRLDAERDSADDVNADVFAIDYVRDRLIDALPEQDMTVLNQALEDLHTAVEDEDLDLVAELAAGLRESVSAITI